MANDPQTEKLCLEYHDAMSHHDWDRIRACFHDDVVWEDVAMGHRYEGLDDVMTFFQQSFPPLEIKVQLNWMLATVEGYCVDTVARGRHVLDVFGLPATGKPFEFRVVSIGKIRDGKVVHGIDTWSLNTLLSQLGMQSTDDRLPPATAAAI
jgi:steroid delta-isomerase-like uncharacterized protein